MGQTQSEEQPASSETQGGVSCRLYLKVGQDKWPILYSSAYDITFGGLEKIHPFDSSKWRRVYQLLVQKKMLKGDADIIQPIEISREELLRVHSQEYIDSLNVSREQGFLGSVISWSTKLLYSKWLSTRRKTNWFTYLYY